MPDIPDSATERSPAWAGWRDRIIAAVFGILIPVMVAIIVGRFQAAEPHLIFSSTESLPFSGLNSEVTIYQVTLSNDGKKEVYDVACAIRVPDSKIDQYKVTADPLLNVLGSVSGDSVNIQIPNLNPAESIQISLLASANHKLPARPVISVRGRGTVGTEKAQTQQESQSHTTPLIALLAGFSAVVSGGLIATVLRVRSSRSSPGSGDDQRQVLAFVCRIHGLRDIADQYSAQVHETTYWAEADRLGQIASDSGDPERAASIERALIALVDYAKIVDNSRAVVYYNIALISRAKKDEPAYKKYLALAKETSPKEVTRRLKVDPRFSSE